MSRREFITLLGGAAAVAACGGGAAAASGCGGSACCSGLVESDPETPLCASWRSGRRSASLDGRRAGDLVIDFRWGAGRPRALCGFTQKS